MKTEILPVAILLIPLFSIATPVAVAQPANQREGTAPIYQVTVVERTVKAINYQYRSGPTMIDFRGTVLLPRAKGEATVESKQGRTEIDANLEGLSDPQLFGTEYLTYVLWAITPEGRPHNIGRTGTRFLRQGEDSRNDGSASLRVNRYGGALFGGAQAQRRGGGREPGAP